MIKDTDEYWNTVFDNRYGLVIKGGSKSKKVFKGEQDRDQLDTPRFFRQSPCK